MHITRRAEFAVQAAAIAWATMLALAGLWLLTSAIPLPRPVLLSAGIGLLGAAQFLCMVLVADHLFPHVYAGLRIAGEVSSFAIFLAGLILSAWFLFQS